DLRVVLQRVGVHAAILQGLLERFVGRELAANGGDLAGDLGRLDLDAALLALLRQQLVDDQLIDCVAVNLVAAILRHRLAGTRFHRLDDLIELRLVDLFAVHPRDEVGQLRRDRLGRRGRRRRRRAAGGRRYGRGRLAGRAGGGRRGRGRLTAGRQGGRGQEQTNGNLELHAHLG